MLNHIDHASSYLTQSTRILALISKYQPAAYDTTVISLKKLEELAPKTSSMGDTLPFVIVARSSLLTSTQIMSEVKSKSQHGEVRMTPKTPADFAPLASLAIPSANLYLLKHISTGRAYLDVTPEAALTDITAQGRSPLTIEEGVALLLHFPEILTDKDAYCAYSLLGSRCGDQRVPAIWKSYGRPRLGWCWDRNPHPWLGSASCIQRIAHPDVE